MQITKGSFVPGWRGTFFNFTVFGLFFLPVFLISYTACRAQIWEDFTVWYDGNGADSGSVAEEAYKSGSDKITLKINAESEGSSDVPFSKKGCTFLGWSLEPEDSSVIAPILPGGAEWDPVDVPITWIEDKQGFVFYARWDCGPNAVRATATRNPTATATPAPTNTPTVKPTAAATKKPTAAPQPTATATARLLISPGNGSRPSETPAPESHRATATPDLLIYPDIRGRRVSKDAGALGYGENADDTAWGLPLGGSGSVREGTNETASAARVPVLFSSAGGDLTALPETGITARRGYSRDQMPASIEYKPTLLELQIPSLDISSAIVSVESDDEGYPIRWLGMDTALLADTAFPGEGFSILAAHNTLDAETFGPFALIRALRKGDRLFIRTDRNELMIFEVYSNEKINEYDYEALYHAGAMYENTVTLLTCEDERPEGGYTNRRIVSARRIN